MARIVYSEKPWFLSLFWLGIDDLALFEQFQVLVYKSTLS
jgi:hypothetical protein